MLFVVLKFEILLICFSVAQAYNQIFFSGHKLLRHRLTDLFAKLPTVQILNLPSQYNTGQKDYKKEINFTSENFYCHAHDSKFILWLESHYTLTVNGTGGDVYFLHAYNPPMVRMDSNWWLGINFQLSKFAENSPPIGFQMDKVFAAFTFPLYTLEIGDLRPEVRNILDMRFIRVDEEFPSNGRDIYVPYIEPRSHWSIRALHVGTRRKYFISAACREPPGHLDSVRLWRTKVFKEWSQTPESLIVTDMNAIEFDNAYLDSDFCVIIPGDSTSTQKLYKAIFAGCIPVVFVSFKEQLPFIHFIDWSQFSIVIAKDIINSPTDMAELLNYLHNIRNTPHVLANFKQAVELVSPLFDFAKSDWPSVYHFTLLELVREKSIFNSTNPLSHLIHELNLKHVDAFVL
jgi:hypothetical protein